MKRRNDLALAHCPIHGYIAFVSSKAKDGGDVYCEQDLIDHPWVQRLRQIHQLQTAWFVFPSAEHSRFQHVLGVMHLASRAVAALYESLKEACPDLPSRGYVESLLRISALLHDVGHGPFGHFFDEHFLSQYHLTHETLGAEIIRRELGSIIRGIRRNPNSELSSSETLAPEHVAFLIVRPKKSLPGSDSEANFPRWLFLLRALFCGIYTIDNMDFVLRDAYMSGFNTRVADIERLFHYSFFTPQGLTIDERGLSSLVYFLSVRGELFRTIYFHRTVRAVDISLEDLFRESRDYFLPGNPLEHLEAYRDFTEWSLIIRTTQEWARSDDATLRALSERWRSVSNRRLPWRTATERTLFYESAQEEKRSIFANREFFAQQFRAALPSELAEIPLRFDLARHTYRPGSSAPADNLNFVMETKTGFCRAISSEEIVRRLPYISYICRVYAQDSAHDAILSKTMDILLEGTPRDDATNV
ncbi:MAG: HD domain-containing protein [Planctomycetia bacterium]|nr:HD domain-containing protein [Planctomycetia bacterium]